MCDTGEKDSEILKKEPKKMTNLMLLKIIKIVNILKCLRVRQTSQIKEDKIQIKIQNHTGILYIMNMAFQIS